MSFLVAQFLLLAAGDVGRCGSPGAARTAELINARPTAAVVMLGDGSYPDGSYTNYLQCFDPYWGPFRPRMYPALGNHEMSTAGAAGYFKYFGSRAGAIGKGYYAVDLGIDWRLYILNSTLSGDALRHQRYWLGDDLTQNPRPCVIAAYHHSNFSSSTGHGDNPHMSIIWDRLQKAHAEIVLTAHSHGYERFARQDSKGHADPKGLQEFVVGTGGTGL